MPFDDRDHALETPERVRLVLDLAGVGSRGLACLLDTAILVGAWITLILVFAVSAPVLGTLALVLALGAGFLLQWFYFTAFESIWNGQTPGKRAVGIRVQKVGGYPVGWTDAMIRNFIRAIDFLMLYGVGIVVMLLNERSQRLGDLAAGTIVVRERASSPGELDVLDPKEFVAENRGDWERLEGLLTQARRGRLRVMPAAELRDLGQLHRKVSADLAAARSLREDSRLTAYLNDLALRSHNVVYSAEARGMLRRLADLVRLVPEAVSRHWGAVGAAFAIFALGVLAGALGTALDESVAVAILGAGFVDRIRRGEYWIARIFDVVPHSVASASILSNNLSVAIAAFAGGITGLFTAAILFLNGLMLGSVLALCAQYRLIGRFLPFVCAHGVLEVSAIVLAGAGGLVMFDGWLDGASGSRREGLRLGAREGLRIALAAGPALLLAGPIEGLVSPGEFLPGGLRIALGVSLGAALWAWLARGSRVAPAAPGAHALAAAPTGVPRA